MEDGSNPGAEIPGGGVGVLERPPQPPPSETDPPPAGAEPESPPANPEAVARGATDPPPPDEGDGLPKQPEAQEVIDPITHRNEIQTLGGMTVLRRVREATRGKSDAEKEAYFAAHPEERVLEQLQLVYDIPAGLNFGEEFFDLTKTPGTAEGKINNTVQMSINGKESHLIGIVSTSPDGSTITFKYQNNDEAGKITLSREEYLRIFVLQAKERAEIVALFEGTPQAEVIDLYLKSSEAIAEGKEFDPGKTPEEMNAFIKEIADREELLTVDDLRIFIEKHAKTMEVEGKLKYDDQKRVEDALKHLKGKNLADAETVENVLREFGLKPDMLADSIAGASKALQKIDKKLSMKVGDHFRLENGNPAVVNQNDIAEWTEEREEAQAAYDVFKEVSAALNNGAIRGFFYKLESGEVPPDEARLIKSAFQSADLKTITDSMLTLDTKMSARKGELRNKREQEEEEARRSALYRKWLAIGLGTPAALAILIALVSRPKSPGGGFGH